MHEMIYESRERRDEGDSQTGACLSQRAVQSRCKRGFFVVTGHCVN
jgi:hypothetical protein